MSFWKKRKPTEPLKLGTLYFVEGEKVKFNLGGMDFTFGKFYLTLSDDELRIKVEDEAPMNILNISGIVEQEIELDRAEIMDADIGHMTLRLRPEVFAKYKAELFRQTDPVKLFGFAADGGYPVRDLKNWVMEAYGTKKEWAE